MSRRKMKERGARSETRKEEKAEQTETIFTVDFSSCDDAEEADATRRKEHADVVHYDVYFSCRVPC